MCFLLRLTGIQTWIDHFISLGHSWSSRTQNAYRWYTCVSQPPVLIPHPGTCPAPAAYLAPSAYLAPASYLAPCVVLQGPTGIWEYAVFRCTSAERRGSLRTRVWTHQIGPSERDSVICRNSQDKITLVIIKMLVCKAIQIGNRLFRTWLRS